MRKLLIVLLFAAQAAHAEGMWMPQQVPQLAGQLERMGLKIDPNRLADLTGDPLGAVISLGGCTASFVSPDGLIVSNHHCVFGSIQSNSSPERDLITNGFLARTRGEELPAAPGTKVWVTTNIEDVTSRVTGNLSSKIGDADRARAINRREKELVAECEKAGGVRCRVSSFFEGSQYLRTTQMEISDIRLVYAPARAIGEFGGEIDNFMWPRHTGDFGFYRAYVEGQPYRPKHWLKVSTGGVNAGDLVLVAGYPGRTFRYKTADEVRNYKEFVYPTSIRYYGDLMRILEEAAKKDRAVAIRNASRIKSLANSLKNYTSVSEGFAKDRIVEAREEREAALVKAGDASVLPLIEAANREHFRTRERDLLLEWLIGYRTATAGFNYRSSPLLTQAYQIYRTAVERAKRDADRASGYQQRDWSSIRQISDRTQRVIDVASDRAGLRYFINEALKLPASQRIDAVDQAVARAGGIEQFLDHLHGGTKVIDQGERSKMYEQTISQLNARRTR